MENKFFSDLSIHSQKENCAEATDNKNMENSTKSNVSLADIDTETIKKLRGDAIGDTMYSQSFVIKVLLQLSDVKWNSKLEDDLCFLWDMTVERDVCEYLYQLSFPSIATAIILKYSEPRLIEIIIGILGNICSNKEITPDITDVEISIVLNALETDDHLVLIQIMRFLIAVVYHKNCKLHFITSEIMEKLCFILTNSINKDLLLCTMNSVAKITSDFKIESELLSVNILNSLFIAYDFVNKPESNSGDDFEEENEEEQKSLNFFIQIVLNICLYVNEMMQGDFCNEFSTKSKELVSRFKNIIDKFCKDKNLLPLTDDTRFYFESFTIIFPILDVKYDKDIFMSLFKIVHLIWKNNEDKIDDFIEFIRFFISMADINDLVKDCENINCDSISTYRFILEHESKCEYNYRENILSIIDKLTVHK